MNVWTLFLEDLNLIIDVIVQINLNIILDFVTYDVEESLQEILYKPEIK